MNWKQTSSFMLLPTQLKSIVTSLLRIMVSLFNLGHIQKTFKSKHGLEKITEEQMIAENYLGKPKEKLLIYKNQYHGSIIIYFVAIGVFVSFSVQTIFLISNGYNLTSAISQLFIYLLAIIAIGLKLVLDLKAVEILSKVITGKITINDSSHQDTSWIGEVTSTNIKTWVGKIVLPD